MTGRTSTKRKHPGLSMRRLTFQDESLFQTECYLTAQRVRSLVWAYEQLFDHHVGPGQPNNDDMAELGLTMMEAMDRMMEDLQDAVNALSDRHRDAMRQRTGT